MLSKLTSFRVLLIAGLLLFCNVLFAQQKTVRGKITDPNNLPVAGATVAVIGSNVATETDVNGDFTISIPNGKNSLTITSVGYEPQTINVANQSNVSLSLVITSSTLNEVVVTGYGTQRKKDISGSVAVVDIGDAKKIPASSSEQLLQGQAAGVTVINSGAPGAASTVFVRGISNFGHTQPLYVIDGVQVGDMSTLNPNDIESISVLKDAGAAAIYGISGGNGVIVVTTKKGRPGKTTISYDAYYGTQRPLSGNVWNLMNPAQQSELAFRANDAATKGLYPGGAGVIPTYGYHGDLSAAGAFGKSGVTNDTACLLYTSDAADDL